MCAIPGKWRWDRRTGVGKQTVACPCETNGNEMPDWARSPFPNKNKPHPAEQKVRMGLMRMPSSLVSSINLRQRP
jgi:hypothetical protein